jgi:hypothetical protein
MMLSGAFVCTNSTDPYQALKLYWQIASCCLTTAVQHIPILEYSFYNCHEVLLTIVIFNWRSMRERCFGILTVFYASLVNEFQMVHQRSSTKRKAWYVL